MRVGRVRSTCRQPSGRCSRRWRRRCGGRARESQSPAIHGIPRARDTPPPHVAKRRAGEDRLASHASETGGGRLTPIEGSRSDETEGQSTPRANGALHGIERRRCATGDSGHDAVTTLRLR
jgi:hypothetical protein